MTSKPPSVVMVPITWNDADREGGVDHWIARATYWHDQCQQAWHTRDMVSDLRQRIDSVLALPHRPWDENEADSAEARSARAYNHALVTVCQLLDNAASASPRRAHMDCYSGEWVGCMHHENDCPMAPRNPPQNAPSEEVAE